MCRHMAFETVEKRLNQTLKYQQRILGLKEIRLKLLSNITSVQWPIL